MTTPASTDSSASTPTATTPTDSPSARSTTGLLLACGVAAGPLFVVVAFAQALLREGFELSRHPLSLLSLGDLGWLQITSFVVAGLLYVAAAIGLKRVLVSGAGATWAPRLLMTFGIAMIAGGVFVADPAYAFPPGTPQGSPDELSWHGILHGFAPAIGFVALSILCFVLARRATRAGRRGWAIASRVTGVAIVALSIYPNLGGDPEGRFGPMWVMLVLALGWLSATLVMLRSEASRGSGATRGSGTTRGSLPTPRSEVR